MGGTPPLPEMKGSHDRRYCWMSYKEITDEEIPVIMKK